MIKVKEGVNETQIVDRSSFPYVDTQEDPQSNPSSTINTQTKR